MASAGMVALRARDHGHAGFALALASVGLGVTGLTANELTHGSGSCTRSTLTFRRLRAEPERPREPLAS